MNYLEFTYLFIIILIDFYLQIFSNVYYTHHRINFIINSIKNSKISHYYYRDDVNYFYIGIYLVNFHLYQYLCNLNFNLQMYFLAINMFLVYETAYPFFFILF